VRDGFLEKRAVALIFKLQGIFQGFHLKVARILTFSLLRVIGIGCCLILSLPILISSPAFADKINYLYDDDGRLIVAISGTEAVIYQYDAVGNLISVDKEAAYPPALQAIIPDVFLIGATYNVTFAGQHLGKTISVTSDNINIEITNVTATDTAISAVLSIANSASPVQANPSSAVTARIS